MGTRGLAMTLNEALSIRAGFAIELIKKSGLRFSLSYSMEGGDKTMQTSKEARRPSPRATPLRSKETLAVRCGKGRAAVRAARGERVRAR